MYRSLCYILVMSIGLLSLKADQLPQTINNNNNINVNVNPTLSTSVESNLSSNLQQNLSAAFNVTSIVAQLRDQAEKTRSYSIQFLSHYKLPLLFTTIATVYLSIFYYLRSLNYALHHHHWSVWRADVMLDEFKSLPAATISQELIIAIQKNYQTAATLTNFLLPLMQFLTDVDKEFLQLNSYVTWYGRFKTLRISRIFFFDMDLLVHIPERMERLAYLKEIFLEWIANYTLITHAPAQSS